MQHRLCRQHTLYCDGQSNLRSRVPSRCCRFHKIRRCCQLHCRCKRSIRLRARTHCKQHRPQCRNHCTKGNNIFLRGFIHIGNPRCKITHCVEGLLNVRHKYLAELDTDFHELVLCHFNTACQRSVPFLGLLCQCRILAPRLCTRVNSGCKGISRAGCTQQRITHTDFGDFHFCQYLDGAFALHAHALQALDKRKHGLRSVLPEHGLELFCRHSCDACELLKLISAIFCRQCDFNHDLGESRAASLRLDANGGQRRC